MCCKFEKNSLNEKSRVRILAHILAKCELKKQIARWYFLHLHFLASENLGPVICGFYPRYKSSLQFSFKVVH